MTAVLIVQISIVALFWTVSAPWKHRIFFRCGAIAMTTVAVLGVVLHKFGTIQPTAAFGFVLLIGGLFVEEIVRLIGVALAFRAVQKTSAFSSLSRAGLVFGLGFGLIELIPNLWTLKDRVDFSTFPAIMAYSRFWVNTLNAVVFHVVISIIFVLMLQRKRPVATLFVGVTIHGLYNLWVVMTFHGSTSGPLLWSLARFACLSLIVWLLLGGARRERGHSQ
jgi:hypothetical protein